MPRPRSISDDLAGEIKVQLRDLALRQVCELHPHVSPGVIQAIKYGEAYQDVPPVGPVALRANRTGKAHKPGPASTAFQFSPRERAPKVLRETEREGYAAKRAAIEAEDRQAEKAAAAALALEHLRRPYLVQISLVVGIERLEDTDDLRAVAAELAARQVLGMAARNRGWTVDAIEKYDLRNS